MKVCIQINANGVHMRMVPYSWGFSWESYDEWVATASDKASFLVDGLREQVSVTWDTTDYLWYMTE